MANCKQNQTWLDMAILDLQESKQTGAMALDLARMLLEEKVLLNEKLKVYHGCWSLEKRRLKEDLVQTKKEHEGKRIAQAYEIAALHVSLGCQQQEALCFKLRLEGALDEVELLFSRLGILHVQLQEKEVEIHEAHERHLQREVNLKRRLVVEKPTDGTQQDASKLLHIVNELKRKHVIEVDKLKNEQSITSSKRKQEISALIREKNFVWEQLKRMEDDYSSRLNAKKQELKCAEDTLQKLQVRMDELQRAHDEKTVELTVLRINVQAAEEEALKLREDLAQLKPSGQGCSISELTCSLLRNANGLAMSCEEANKVGGLGNKQELLASKDDQASKLLSEKEEELKKAKKLMDELRLENQNLRVLYADLEGQLKDKQKPEKANREPAKDATTRNLTADLEAVAAAAAQTSVKACTELKRRKVLARESCEEENPRTSDPATSILKEQILSNDEVKGTDNTERSSVCLLQQSLELKSELTSSVHLTKNRLFSSVFGIPKVLAGS